MTNHTFKTGDSREQACLLPPRIEDCVGPDNPVRAIESFVCVLDVGKLGFRHADRGVEVAQPLCDPADLLKLYLYGYINQIRSSRSGSIISIYLLRTVREYDAVEFCRFGYSDELSTWTILFSESRRRRRSATSFCPSGVQ